MTRKSVSILLAASLLMATAAAAGPKRVGKNPGKVKGRWLEVADVGALGGYDKVAIGEIAVDIQWKNPDRESDIDDSILVEKIRDHLTKRLEETGLYQEVAGEPAEEGAAGWLRLDVDLSVDPGSRAARYVVGLGAGKSRSILKIHLKDHASGEELGLYHGHGTGSGMGFKLGGGSARKMTEDDVQENTKNFAQLLKQFR